MNSTGAQMGRSAPVIGEGLSRQEASRLRTGPDLCSPCTRAQHLGDHALQLYRRKRRRGHSIEPTATGTRTHSMGEVCVIADVQGAWPPHRYSQHEITESITRSPGFAAFEEMVRKLYASYKGLEFLRATARLAFSTPCGKTTPLDRRKPDPGVGERAGPQCKSVSSGPSASVIPSAPALE
jgi:hypothetical protein